jgi:hypothetical protein
MSESKYAENGVILSKSEVTVGEQVTITYHGWLASSGTQNVYAHIGYGEGWKELADVPMKKEKSGVFKAKVKLTNPGSLNICFKDDWNSWDNNSGHNYSFEILNKEAIATSPTAKASKPKLASKTTESTPKKTATVSATRKTPKA